MIEPWKVCNIACVCCGICYHFVLKYILLNSRKVTTFILIERLIIDIILEGIQDTLGVVFSFRLVTLRDIGVLKKIDGVISLKTFVMQSMVL